MTVQPGDVTFFVDRSLGEIQVARALRGWGWDVVTLADRYGRADGEELDDIDWISDAAAEGEVCLCKDKRIASVPAEAEAVHRSGARVFAIGSGQVTSDVMIGRLERHLSSMLRLVEHRSGPFVVSVSDQSLNNLRLNYP